MLPAKKSLGQNFLTAAPVANSIVAALRPVPGDLIFEIGPGRGALTEPLAKSGATVVAFEIDEPLVALLREKLAAYPNVEIHHADFLSVNLDAAAEERGQPRFKLAGNIPYNLTSTILIDLVRWCSMSEAILMVQKEVGERILAPPGERACGILSIFLQAYFIIEEVIRVHPGSFTPPPKVESEVLRFVPLVSGEGPADREAFLRFLKASFAHRRKKLRNVLGDRLGAKTAIDWERLSEQTGVDFDLRPERLALESWYRLFAVSRRPKGSR